jgi:hypothetical protein
VSAHGLPGSRPVSVLDGGEDTPMTQKRFLFSLLGLQVSFSGFTQKVNQGE